MDACDYLIIHVTKFNVTIKIYSYVLVRRTLTNVKLNVYQTAQTGNVVYILSNALFYMYILYVLYYINTIK